MYIKIKKGTILLITKHLTKNKPFVRCFLFGLFGFNIIKIKETVKINEKNRYSNIKKTMQDAQDGLITLIRKD